MLKVGITGGIGSGKSTACRIFATLGIPVYYADDRAKQLMNEDPDLMRKITSLLGEKAYRGGLLNRDFVAQIVFQDPEKLQALNAIVHPAVGRDAEEWQQNQHGVPYILKEAALLFEAGSYRQLDKMICVVAPEKLRIKRVMERDQVDESAVRARMDKQWPQHQKMLRSDFLLYNDGTHPLIKQIFRIHHRLLSLSVEQR